MVLRDAEAMLTLQTGTRRASYVWVVGWGTIMLFFRVTRRGGDADAADRYAPDPTLQYTFTYSCDAATRI